MAMKYIRLDMKAKHEEESRNNEEERKLSMKTIEPSLMRNGQSSVHLRATLSLCHCILLREFSYF